MLVIQSEKADYDAEILDIKYFTTVDYNKFTNENLDLNIKKRISQ